MPGSTIRNPQSWRVHRQGVKCIAALCRHYNARRWGGTSALDRMLPARDLFTPGAKTTGGDQRGQNLPTKSVICIIPAVTNDETKLHSYFDGIAKLIADNPAHLPALKKFAREVQSAYTPAAPAPPEAMYANRADKSELAPDFIKRVYGHLLDGEFTRPDLHHIDPAAEKALRDWEYRYHRLSLDELNLPTEEERNNRLIEGLHREPDPLRRQALKYIQQKRNSNRR